MGVPTRSDPGSATAPDLILTIGLISYLMLASDIPRTQMGTLSRKNGGGRRILR